LDQVRADAFNTVHFGARDIVPLGYAAFGFALGVTAGLLIRRLLPAIMTALIGFVAMREIVNAWVLPNLMAPFHKMLPITASTPVSVDQTSPGVISAFESTKGVNIPNAWVYSVKIVDNAGHAATTSFLKRACPLGNYGPVNPRDCTASLTAKFHQLVTYQPASHYWPMQWYELAIFLGLATVLGGLCFWWIRRPVS
ncbi:MAG: transporter, partial [Acidimicrobiales bacterium]